jgi:hypothetical protein
MVQSILSIPTPIDADPDVVVTALETAAVFASKGDAAEALRWLKRAAESAGEADDDARTLVLARSAAELVRQLQDSANHAEVVSSSPPRSSVPAGTSATAASAPPTSRKWLPKPPSRSAPAPEDRTSARPLPPSARTPVSTPRPPRVSSPAAASSLTIPSQGPALDREASNGKGPAASVGQSAGSPRLRTAMRVSVVASPTERGLYCVRVLDEGSPPDEGTEGLLVLVDPDATLPLR